MEAKCKTSNNHKPSKIKITCKGVRKDNNNRRSNEPFVSTSFTNKQVPKNCSRHGSDKYVKFDVHINDDEDNLSEPDQTEFVGTFVNLFHGQGHNIKVTSFKVGISKVLDCLEAEEDDVVLVTLVPKVGKGDVIIGGIKVEFIPKYKD
ncbi:hypothetical protein JHK84_028062 [Glycine max]|nr:hypothetical protein JHK85_028463 [Glycine max]KAG5151590.1 hypothetical protein JHK84_028062 [Glycine max]